MIQIVTPLDSLYFTSMIPDIEVNCYDSLTFTLNKGSDVILKEMYWANNKSRVWIRDLGKVIAADLGGVPGLSSSYTLNLTDGNTSASKTFRVIIGEKRIENSSSNFALNNFLTLLNGWKLTHAWQIEILSLFTTTAVDITLETVALDGTRVGPTVIRNISTINQVVEIDVSPERIITDPSTISRYIIKAGNRMMIYYLDNNDRVEEPELLFRNSFGCRESFVPKGLVERQNEYENSTGYIRDMLFRFRTKETKKFETNTGVLSDNHAQWAEDLFVSNEVFLKLSTALVPVTINDATVIRSNAPDELISFDFKYQLSRPDLYGAGKIDIKRIFDDTFDYTFH